MKSLLTHPKLFLICLWSWMNLLACEAINGVIRLTQIGLEKIICFQLECWLIRFLHRNDLVVKHTLWWILCGHLEWKWTKNIHNITVASRTTTITFLLWYIIFAHFFRISKYFARILDLQLRKKWITSGAGLPINDKIPPFFTVSLLFRYHQLLWRPIFRIFN